MEPRDFVLTTERTELRPFAHADGPELFHLFRDPQVRGGLLDDVLVSPGWLEHEIDTSAVHFRRSGIGLWSVRLAGRPEIVGFVGFREVTDSPEPNLLYGLLPEHWGRGLATEITARVCDFAFRELHIAAVTATTDVPNRASARVLRHLGMELVRTEPDGTIWFALDRGTWFARAASISTAANKALVRRYYEDVVSSGAVERLAEFVAPDYVEVDDDVRHELGLAGAREHVLGVRRTYPDLRLTVEQQIAEGEWVVSRVTMRGTHRGEWLGIAPTGRAIAVTAVNVDRVVGGRIVEHGGAANLLGPMLAIGAVRVGTSAEGTG